jgi:hypothetical protein
MIKYKYENQLNLDKMIQDVIYEIYQCSRKINFEKLNVTFLLMAISYFTKTEFKQVDKQFSEFGKMFLELINQFPLNEYVDYEKDLIIGAFSKLVLNNLSFSQSELFPNNDIQMIKSGLQVELLLDGRNFILLPYFLIKCTDIGFKFK